jgi:hypothetical protein
MALPLLGQEPARLTVEPTPALLPRPEPSANQQVAETIADHLRQSGQLHRYHLDVVYQDGTAELSGVVADQPQREEALRIAQAIPGVERVVNHVALADAVTPVQATAPVPTLNPPRPLPPGSPLPPGAVAGVGAEPVPVFQAPTPAPYDLTPPKMPPYAWPTYAPYNNYSRVAYPLAYPYQSWPFIGPPYPFPKVPLGWRSVKLQWEDGHWWFSKTATPHDWWHLRYW